MLSEDDLRATFATASAHMDRGGVFVTAPDWLRETFTDPFVSTGTNRRGDVSLTNVEYTWDPDPRDTTMETLGWYLIREGGALRVEQDRHVLGLFPKETWIGLLDEAGFDVETDEYPVHEDKRQAYLFVGKKR